MDIPTRFIESLFCFAKVLNMVMIQNLEIILGQTLNCSVYNFVIFKFPSVPVPPIMFGPIGSFLLLAVSYLLHMLS
jgi:hypothetical protein